MEKSPPKWPPAPLGAVGPHGGVGGKWGVYLKKNIPKSFLIKTLKALIVKKWGVTI
jgi:hypothetical protein